MLSSVNLNQGFVVQKINLNDGEIAVPSEMTGGKYWITNQGRVFRAPCKYRPSWNEVFGETTKKGYHRVTLSFGNVSKKYYVHRIVCQAFIENNESKPFVNHIDGNKLNNNVKNLEWCTSSENERHSFDVLGKVGNRTKPEFVRQSVVNLRLSGLKLREVAEQLSVSMRYVKYVMQDHGKLNLT